MQYVTALGLVALFTASTASCNSASTSPPDAPIDTPTLPRVQRIDCPASVAVEITEVALPGGRYNYSPNPAMVRAGGVVRFRANEIHSTRSDENGLFDIYYGQTECFRFNTRETHKFTCTAHGFTGSIVVQ
jgi:plastocyanin